MDTDTPRTDTPAGLTLAAATAARIEAARIAAGLTQQELAERTGISQPTLSRKLKPKRPGRDKFDTEELGLIADALNVKASALLREAEEAAA